LEDNGFGLVNQRGHERSKAQHQHPGKYYYCTHLGLQRHYGLQEKELVEIEYHFGLTTEVFEVGVNRLDPHTSTHHEYQTVVDTYGLPS